MTIRKLTGLTFSQALEAMKTGSHVTRPCWGGDGLCIDISIVPRSECGKVARHIQANLSGDSIVPMPRTTWWTASNDDHLAEDWSIVV